jgi:hypothetical protein
MENIIKEKKGWVITLHFGRAHSEMFFTTDKEEAFKMFRIAVEKNEDCINAHVMRVG